MARAGAIATVVVLVGCAGTPARHAPPPPPPPPIHATDTTPPGKPVPPPAQPGFPAMARAALVVASGMTLVAYALDGDRPTEIGRLALAGPDDDMPSGGAWWIDRDHIIVQAGFGSDAFLAVTPAATTVLAGPAESAFDGVPSPGATGGAGDPPTRGGQQWGEAGGGKLVWHVCVWGYAYDEGQCVRSATVQVWPPDGNRITVVPDAMTPSHAMQRDDDPRWVEARPAFAVGWGSNMHTTCGGHVRTTVMPGANGSSFGTVHWLANPGHASAALVVYEQMGATLVFASDFAVYDRCTDHPIFVGESVQLLPGNLWVGREWKTGRVPADGEDIPPDAHVHRLHRGVVTLGDLANGDVLVPPP